LLIGKSTRPLPLHPGLTDDGAIFVYHPPFADRDHTMSETHRITFDPNQCGGRPCLRSLRIGVKDILDLLAAGASREEILGDYPLLEAGGITAALEYAALQSDHPVLRVA
jgi:uncharacterized protein (DUF433 family)